MAIEWQDSYKLGDAEIDAQHQELFHRVNTLLAATGITSLTLAAVNLSEYAVEHFTHEETVMRRIGYPDMAAHIEHHDVLISKLNAVSTLIGNYTLNMADFESFLSVWLLNHMETSDAQLAAYILLT